MELKKFKKAINTIFLSKGLSKKGSYYYFIVDDLTIVVGLQKSNYANGYYINIGYVIKQLNLSLQNPRDVDGDVRGRFSFSEKGKSTDYLDLELVLEDNQQTMEKQIEENINRYISSVASMEGLRNLLQKEPTLLYQTKLSAKQLLGFS